MAQPLGSVRRASLREARELIHLAREAMVTRARDLDGIIYANERDVRVVDAGDGLALVGIGLLPAYRALVETIYVFILLKNGVPVGYYQAALLFGSAELNFNIFDPYRGAEAAQLYGRSLAVVRHLFAVDTFSVEPYQLGLDNDEALHSGAFWFYQKLGFVSHDPQVRGVLKAELRRMSANPAHRSSLTTLAALARSHLFFYLDEPRDDVTGKVALGRIALAVSDWLAERFGSDRERALRHCRTSARRLLGIRSLKRLTAGERSAFERWSPLVCALPDVASWSRDERRRLASVVMAKGADGEDDYAARLSAHLPLRRALMALAATR
jgi:hypothetical protein